jgi:hypothetical protein
MIRIVIKITLIALKVWHSDSLLLWVGVISVRLDLVTFVTPVERIILTISYIFEPWG